MADQHKSNEEQAFPAHLTTKTIWGDVAIKSSPGLTKRELFAAMAMQGMCGDSIPGSHHMPKNIAREAVECADALLAALRVPENPDGR